MAWEIRVRRSPRLIGQRFRFVVVADNGEKVAQSEMYRRRADALASADRLANASMVVVDESR